MGLPAPPAAALLLSSASGYRSSSEAAARRSHSGNTVALAPPIFVPVARALFVCLHNAGRSQMSAALLGQVASDRHEARSAGTTPGERVHPEVVEVMRELGIDLSDRKPQPLTTELAEWADAVVTMGCGDECPYIPGKRYIDWDLPDPKGQPLDEVRATRDDILDRVRELATELDTIG
jgi:arsenate reductase